MQQIKLKCLVIREVDFSEHDRYITVLTEHGRKLEVLCRGVRRKNKAGAAATRLFCWSELELFERRGKYALDGASLINSFWGVTQDVEAYALACYLAELAAAMSDPGEDVPALTRLFLGALHMLSTGKRAPCAARSCVRTGYGSLSGRVRRLAGAARRGLARITGGCRRGRLRRCSTS